MGANPHIHVPKESWPNWIWYAIECIIVIGVSMLASSQITDSIEGISELVEVQNYVFMGFVGIFFLVWYIGIRGIILKKKILGNNY